MSDENKKNGTRHAMKLMLKAIIVTTILIGSLFSFSYFMENNVEKPEGLITEIKLKSNSSDIRYDSFWIAFVEYDSDIFYDPKIQKQFDECHNSGGEFGAWSEGTNSFSNFECRDKSKMEIIVK